MFVPISLVMVYNWWWSSVIIN